MVRTHVSCLCLGLVLRLIRAHVIHSGLASIFDKAKHYSSITQDGPEFATYKVRVFLASSLCCSVDLASLDALEIEFKCLSLTNQ